ncbi:MAG: RDD family protein [Simkaniaceae bacterium]|nr:RDD family protein [Simkaniaceae bacterium]
MDLLARGSEVLLDVKAKGRPWTRFWARMLDYLIFLFVIGVLSAIFNISFPGVPPLYSAIFLLFLWVFVESCLVCTWGTTPGKSLFCCCVRTSEGKKLSFIQALNRSFGVWWMGMGAGIPIIIPITMLIASVKLSNCHITTWDRTGHFVVEHRPVGIVRIVVAILLFGFISLLLYGAGSGSFEG